MAYLVADTSNAGGNLRRRGDDHGHGFLDDIHFKMLLILVSLGRRTGSFGSTSVVEVGSFVTPLAPVHCVLSLGRLGLPMVGSCVTTLGLVTFVVGSDTSNKDIDVNDEGILVTSIFFPLPLPLEQVLV